ncbi:MAG: histidine kinase [candidate division Zixibacteria bacterium HGW-Zixibacteria-1]|nr:MAG: histidine kinase [candidate division Zixibacteria bacterium HGW-Zixibacteria-1]
MPKILLVDDENKFRESLAKRLSLRGYETVDVDNGEDAIKLVRADSDIDVVLLDRKMPGMNGEQVLNEIKSFRPELQVIMLTAFGSLQSAMEIGRLEAYSYMEKPTDFEEIVKTIDAAREDKVHVMARHEVPQVEKGSLWKWLIGTHNTRPGVILLGILLFTILIFMPSPQRLMTLLSAPKTGQVTDSNFGFANYRQMKDGETIAEYYSTHYKVGRNVTNDQGKKTMEALTPEETSVRARIMLGVLLVAALFWATGAIPVGVTALLTGVMMYFFGILKPDDIAQAFAKDAVIFIFGVLAVSAVISKTGLDRRIGLLLLGPSKNIGRLLFLFLPMLGVACSFVSEHALIAFIMPLFMMVYITSIRAAGVKRDRALAVMFVLSICFAANCGGPGSPAAGGRNAVMLGILSDYGNAPTFIEWVKYGLPFVPVMGLVIATYFYFMFRRKLKVKELNVSSIVRNASEKIGPMNRDEYITAFALIGLILLWILGSDKFGMGGPVILCIVFLNVFRILRWRDIANIPWDVVFLYASASAIGKGLAVTGGALYMADSFINILPDFLTSGSGLAIAVSLFTGITTNFMSDGATVSAIGPIAIPMATISGSNPWMIGLATAFASSFAHMLIIGTPNNAIAYAMAKDPITGEQLVKLSDFFKHGFVILLLSFAVLWFWVILGYWQFLGF